MNNEEREIINKTKELIDELKSISENNGIGNSPSEYKIITEVFLYKFLNDKFLYEIKKVDENLAKLDKPKDVEKALETMKDDYDFLLLRLGPDTAKLKIEHLISYLFSHKNDEDFYKVFDDTLIDIANFNIDIFSVRTGGKEKIRLFSGISQHITETSKKNNFARAIIDKLVEFSFENLFKQKYDAFAIVFEYLIKDYNKDFGKYAEYYTPNSIARIIARILVKDDEKVENVTVYDPSAGSGTLVLALAHQIGEENCTIYTQDISQKSNEFLRLNLILNNLVHSLGNVVHGNTLTEPAHYNETKTRLAEFDYIVSNPPFKTDFSEYRDELADDKLRERFFAGVPKIPNKDKDKMAIYLMFIQHIIYSLSKKGKAAIVVPTGFLTAQSGIEKKIREKLVEEEMIKGVKDAGFNAIRIPVTWGEHMDGDVIQKEWLDRVQEVVDYAYDNDMFVILNMHHDDYIWFNPTESEYSQDSQKLCAIWEQISERFKDYGDRLLFEGMNEPRTIDSENEWTGGTPEERAVINKYEQDFINTVRSSGGNNAERTLVITSYAASAETVAIDDITIPDDKNIIVSVHYYAPWKFSEGIETSFTDNGKDELDKKFAELKEKFIDKGTPVIIGEFGCVNASDNDTRAEYYNYYLSSAKNNGIKCFIWDNAKSAGESSFGLFNRNNLSWNETILNSIKSAE